MFIYSIRASTLKFFGVVALSLAALIALIIFIPTMNTSAQKEAFTVGSRVSYENVKSADDRIAFLSQFGWQAAKETEKHQTVTIPESFDSVYAGYNDMQKAQGLDLSKYKQKEVEKYTYEVTNYPEYTGKVYVNLLVYRDTVIGGDLSSADINGFTHGLEKN